MNSLAGRVVLITGASSGIGAAAAESCARAGCRVALAARRVERLQGLAERLNAPDSVLLIPTDMRSPEAIRNMVEQTEARFGRIDALLANAGVGHAELFADSSEETLMEQVEVNFLAVLRCVRAVLPGMLERGSGHILTIASVAAEIPSPKGVIYGATKGGVLTFTEGLRRELEPRGIHVTAIQPGFVRTEMTASVPMAMPPASVVGDLVVDLMRRPRRRAVIPRWYGAGIWLSRFAPRLTDRILKAMIGSVEWRGKS